MEQKALRNNRPKAWEREFDKPKLKRCPFCGGVVQSRVAVKTGARWFDCPICSMALKFEALSPDNAIDAWNTRAGDEE